VVRFLLGLGEAAAFPNSNRIIAYWFGADQRGIANSIFLMGIGAGGTLTPVLIQAIMHRWGWRTSFYACGFAGIVVALGWYVYATSRPEEHPRVNAPELSLILSRRGAGASLAGLGQKPRGVTWRRLFSSVRFGG